MVLLLIPALLLVVAAISLWFTCGGGLLLGNRRCRNGFRVCDSQRVGAARRDQTLGRVTRLPSTRRPGRRPDERREKDQSGDVAAVAGAVDDLLIRRCPMAAGSNT